VFIGTRLRTEKGGICMGRAFLGNAFSLQMLDLNSPTTVRVEPVTANEIPASAESVIGHADTAAVVGSILGREVAFNRANVKLVPGDVLYVAQVVGGRLPEGATVLPEGFTLTFVRVEV
jgi:hypothetical protein